MGRKGRTRRNIMGMLLCCAVFTGLFARGMEEKTVRAARTEEIPGGSQIIYFEDGSSLSVESDEEKMTITGTHVKSSARISYITTGYNMTLEKTGGYVEGKDFKKIKLIEKHETITDEVTTSYILDRQSIVDGAYSLFKKNYRGSDENEVWMKFVEEISVKGGLEFYLHNIFAVIERTGGSGSTVTATSKSYNNLGTAVGVLPKVPGILNAVKELYGSDWGAGTKKKLPEYYDIHLKLYVKPTFTSMVLATENGQILKTCYNNLPIYMNAQVRFSFPVSLKEGIEIGEDTYRVTSTTIRKSFVYYHGDMAPSQFYSIQAEDGLRIRLGSGEISFRQLKEMPSVVYLICEKVEPEKVEKPPEEITQEGEVWRMDRMEPENNFTISAWEAGNPYFDVEDGEGGIPVNENLVVEGEIWKYLLEAEFEAKHGEITFQVPVRRTYHLYWQEIVGVTETGPIYQSFQETRNVEVFVPVVRKFSYAQLNRLEYCGIEEFYVENEALPDGEIRVKTGEGVLEKIEIPEISYRHYEGQEAHMQYPPEVLAGIDLPQRFITGNLSMPSLPMEDFASIADARVSGIQVRDDAFSFDGVTYLVDEWKEFQPGMEISLSRKLSGLREKNPVGTVCSDALLIPEKTGNGTHGSFGEIKYVQKMVYPGENSAGEGEYLFELADINSVHIHTPVYCDIHYEADNRKYTQLVSPMEGAVQLVLDPEGITSELWLSISNTGYHSGRKGYGERDYARTLINTELSYLGRDGDGVLRNEVRFPFDVFWDEGVVYSSADDRYIPAGTWVAIGLSKVRFYLPEWVFEGVYTIECRSVAVSCPDDTETGENEANREEENYIATDSITVQVSGRIFGLCLYDIADYPLWEGVFRDNGTGRIKNQYEGREDGTRVFGFHQDALYRYRSGLADSYGRRGMAVGQYLLPVIKGAHPFRKDALIKTGYLLRFSVTTIGERMARESSYVRIQPRFFWVDEKGKNREEVDLYYTGRSPDGRKELVKIGSNRGEEDVKTQKAGSEWLGIPKKERQAAEKVWGVIDEEQDVPMYTYSGICGNRFFRTLKNFSYCENIMGKQQYPLMQYRGISEERLVSLEQGNYFEYSLPYNVQAVKKDYAVEDYAAGYGIDFTEEFWKKEGYLIVSFELMAMVQGEEYLNYDNTKKSTAFCNMWELEAMQQQRQDKEGVSFRFYPGDVLVFPLNTSIKDDHRFGGIY
ncbi:MAG: hypothetical protein K2N63_07510 [Lachnospiraceae bacterium]|nr:hypothetical protein [Lachnospiraceae bacterium]